MPVNKVLENVLGTLGAVCWTIQLLPQIWKSRHDKSTEGLSPWLMLIWGASAGFLGVYTIVQQFSIPLMIQPQIFGFLALVSWGQCQYYSHKRPFAVALAVALSAMVLVGGFEVAMVFAIRPSYSHGNQHPVIFFGIASCVLISAGLLPQYYEIYQTRRVLGVSMLFMTIDILGGVFSDLSLAFRDDFDILAGIAYTLVIVSQIS
ncbi:PQ loop repeat-domain-containing protein [Infundibulicybe gibba]|nr:PQ loop repeat-domain-containing protein [Infundibulicybe gibba]